MPFKRVPGKFNASIREVTIGTGAKALKLGGANVLPLYAFDEPIKNPPKVGIEISDKGQVIDLPEIKKFYGDAKTPADLAKKAVTVPGVSFISLYLESQDPNGDNQSVEKAIETAKSVVDAAGGLPVFIQGCKNEQKDSELFTKISEALRGKNCLFISAKEGNSKQAATAVVQAGEAKLAAESAVDLNLAKQLNVLIGQTGVDLSNIVMNVGQAAAGYGFEYLVSTMDRIQLAALEQSDAHLQVPIITPAGQEAWGVKEAVASEEDMPDWGSQEQRGIDMEITTATAVIAAGCSAVILRHPKSVETVSSLVKALM